MTNPIGPDTYAVRISRRQYDNAGKVCPVCGEANPLLIEKSGTCASCARPHKLEKHHLLGKAFRVSKADQEIILPVSRNAHRLLSDLQVNHPPSPDPRDPTSKDFIKSRIEECLFSVCDLHQARAYLSPDVAQAIPVLAFLLIALLFLNGFIHLDLSKMTVEDAGSSSWREDAGVVPSALPDARSAHPENRLGEPKREIRVTPAAWSTAPARPTEAIVRAHLVEDDRREDPENPGQAGPDHDPGWNVRLIFDTETTTDEFANLRFGTYIVEWDNPATGAVERRQAGFFTGESLSPNEAKQIEDYCRRHGLTCMTRREWLNKVFFRYGYKARGAIVGFNLPFDLSRVATRAGGIKRAQDPTKKNWNDDFYAGGWKLRFNEYRKKDQPGQWRERPYRPMVMVKPLSSRACIYSWSYFRAWKEKGDRLYKGHFLDLRTLGCALSGKDNGSLKFFGELFGARVKKIQSREHGGPLTDTYLDYAMNDAEATLSLYYAEMDEFQKYQLNTTADKIYSGASLGKARLQTMGLSGPPVLDTSATGYSQDEIMGFAFSAYFAARSEAQIVKIPVPVTYVDFHGMYPAVSILQGLWDLMKAERVVVSDATPEAVEFLHTVRRSDLFKPETWKKLPILCLVDPADDVMPVRLPVQNRKESPLSYQNTLALVASSNEPLWVTLADCEASTLDTGKPPHILKAFKVSPEGSRPLESIAIRGEEKIDANQEDFFRALVEARDRADKEGDQKLAKALKIVTNATSYGIWAEIDTEDGERSVTAYGSETRRAVVPHGERPGRYYFPPLAAFITSGARLMLKLLESEIEWHGGQSAFCDTDSLAIVSSEKGGTVSDPDHHGKSCKIPVLSWAEMEEALLQFEILNPYRSGAPLIKLEKENFEEKDREKPRVDLHAYVIAGKRYALYVPLRDGTVRIIKPSYHTLGIVEPPRDGNGHEVTGWIEDLWSHIVTGRRYDPPWIWQPVEFHMDISRPEIWNSFRKIRSKTVVQTGNPWMMDRYLSRVKPFNFLAVLARTGKWNTPVVHHESKELKGVPVIAPIGLEGGSAKRRWVAKNTGQNVYPMLPDKENTEAFSESVKTEQGAQELTRKETVEDLKRIGWLVAEPMTFKELLADYQRHHESKAVDFYGGETDTNTLGRLAHPRVKITGLLFTGKESVLHNEADIGIVSKEELESYRFMIEPDDPAMEAMGFLSKAELERLGIGHRTAEKIKAAPASLAQGEIAFDFSLSIDSPKVKSRLIAYLRGKYPSDVGEAADEDVLRTFVESRKNLLEQWKALRPRLANVPTQELIQIAGCSPREARYIKRGREPGIELIRKIVRYGDET